MDKLKKSLLKLSAKEREVAELLISRIVAGDTANLDVRKLKGLDDVYRICKGDLRIIYTIKNDAVTIIDATRRSDTTYNVQF